jgi:chitinase
VPPAYINRDLNLSGSVGVNDQFGYTACVYGFDFCPLKLPAQSKEHREEIKWSCRETQSAALSVGGAKATACLRRGTENAYY